MCHAILLISSPDQRGITASVTDFIYTNNGNIVHADQHIDEQSNTFFMRIEWSLDGFNIARDKIGGQFEMGRPAGIRPGQDQRMQMAANANVQFKAPGGYVVIARVDGEELRRVFFTVAGVQAAPAQQGGEPT